MTRSSIIVFVFLLTAGVRTFGGDGDAVALRRIAALDSASLVDTPAPSIFTGLFEGRKGTAAIYSLVVPGSGQTMLGSPYKGFSFTFVAFGSTLTALISHNNFVASNERLDALEFQYKTSTSWQVSNSLYGSMNETFTKLKRYQRMRNTFTVISVVVWSLNMADVLWNTEDEGETVFSLLKVEQAPVTMADGSVDRQTRLMFTLPLGGKP